jgi:hypothetical protein
VLCFIVLGWVTMSCVVLCCVGLYWVGCVGLVVLCSVVLCLLCCVVLRCGGCVVLRCCVLCFAALCYVVLG